MKRCVLAFTLMLASSVVASSEAIAAEGGSPRMIPEGATPRERFLKLLDRSRVPLQADERPAEKQDGLEEIAFAFDSEAGQRVPGLLVKAPDATGRRAVVIALHGTGGSKAGLRPLLRKVAEQGLIGVAIDGRYAGDRARGTKGTEAYQSAILETWKSGQGFPFLYDTVWDVMRLLDYLETRPDVDAQRIGVIGFSKGGMESYLAGAVDPRLSVLVPCIGVQSYGWALENDAWRPRIATIQNAVNGAARDAGIAAVDAAFVKRFYERVVPGVNLEFDGPVMLPLIAPRPLMVINGDRDDKTPVPGLQLCVDAARQAYDRAGASAKFEFILQKDTGHTVTEESQRRALAWLVENLK